MVGMMNMQQVISPSDKIKRQMDAAATAPLQTEECVIPKTGEQKLLNCILACRWNGVFPFNCTEMSNWV